MTQGKIFKKTIVTKRTLDKIYYYGYFLKELTGHELECMGYLTSPIGKKDEIIYDASYIINQEVTDSNVYPNPDGDNLTMDKIHERKERIVGIWHYHAAHEAKPSSQDDKMLRFLFTGEKKVLKKGIEAELEFTTSGENETNIVSFNDPHDPSLVIQIQIDGKVHKISYQHSEEITYATSIIVNNKCKYDAEVIHRKWDENSRTYSELEKDEHLEIEVIQDNGRNLAEILDDVYYNTLSRGEKLSNTSYIQQRYKELKENLLKIVIPQPKVETKPDNSRILNLFETEPNPDLEALLLKLTELHPELKEDPSIAVLLKKHTLYRDAQEVQKNKFYLEKLIKGAEKLFSEGLDLGEIISLAGLKKELKDMLDYSHLSNTSLATFLEEYDELKQRVNEIIETKEHNLKEKLNDEFEQLKQDYASLLKTRDAPKIESLLNNLEFLAKKYHASDNNENESSCKEFFTKLKQRLLKIQFVDYLNELKNKRKYIEDLDISDVEQIQMLFSHKTKTMPSVPSKYDNLSIRRLYECSLKSTDDLNKLIENKKQQIKGDIANDLKRTSNLTNKFYNITSTLNRKKERRSLEGGLEFIKALQQIESDVNFFMERYKLFGIQPPITITDLKRKIAEQKEWECKAVKSLFIRRFPSSEEDYRLLERNLSPNQNVQIKDINDYLYELGFTIET